MCIRDRDIVSPSSPSSFLESFLSQADAAAESSSSQESLPQTTPEEQSTPAASSSSSEPEEAPSSQAPSQPEVSQSQEDIPIITGDNFLSRVEQGIIDEINAERASLGLGQLTYDVNLRSAARIRVRELYKNNYFDHTRPNGDPWQTVLRDEIPVSYAAAGENLASLEYNDPGLSYHTDPHWWFMEWKNSPSHYELICKPEIENIGVGVYYVKKDGVKYAFAAAIMTKNK